MRLYNRNCEKYWNKLDAKPSLPANAFNFIGIHFDNIKETFSLSAPLCIIDNKRPKFESKKFESFNSAKSYAKRLASKIGLHVVNCTMSSDLTGNRFYTTR